jgi:RNA polymerase sigma-70 factor (ECF subfamily)
MLAEPAAHDGIQSLISRAQAGDKAAYADLYRQHHRRIYALCLRMTSDKSRAEDLTQEAFIRAWQNLHLFRGESQFSTWLHRVAVNTVLTWQRKHGPWLRLFSSADEDTPDPVHHESPGTVRDLEGAMAQLPLRARQVFVLVDVEGYTHEEAADMLGITAGTSKSQLFRARQLLREKLA